MLKHSRNCTKSAHITERYVVVGDAVFMVVVVVVITAAVVRAGPSARTFDEVLRRVDWIAGRSAVASVERRPSGLARLGEPRAFLPIAFPVCERNSFASASGADRFEHLLGSAHRTIRQAVAVAATWPVCHAVTDVG